MRGMSNPIILWLIGAIMLVFCTVGVLAAAMVIALPLYLGASLLGASQETLINLLLYSAPLWAPIGFGAGAATSGTLVRGIRRARDPQAGE